MVFKPAIELHSPRHACFVLHCCCVMLRWSVTSSNLPTHKQKLVVQHSGVDARQHFSATQLFQCGIHYLNMLCSHLLLVCLEAILIESIWINSHLLNVSIVLLDWSPETWAL